MDDATATYLRTRYWEEDELLRDSRSSSIPRRQSSTRPASLSHVEAPDDARVGALKDRIAALLPPGLEPCGEPVVQIGVSEHRGAEPDE